MALEDIEFGSYTGEAPVSDMVGGGGFSWGDLGRSIYGGIQGFGNLARAAMPAAQLGLAGLGVYQGIKGGQQLADQTKIAERAAQTQAGIAGQAQAAAAPLAAFSQTSLDRAASGTIDPAIQTQIDLWAQGAKQKAQQYAASSGQGNSQQLVTWLSWIDQQAEGMKAQAIQDMQTQGIQAGGTAGGILGAASGAAGSGGQIATGQQQSIEALIAGANQVLAQLTAGAA